MSANPASPLGSQPLGGGQSEPAEALGPQTEAQWRAEVQVRLRFETLLTDLSARFVHLPGDQVDLQIEEAQRSVCACLGLDRSTLWEVPPTEPGGLSLISLHQPAGSVLAAKDVEARRLFPWLTVRLRRGETVVISSLEELPAAASLDREGLRRNGTKAAVIVPLAAGGTVVGGLTFETLREERTWPQALVSRFQLIAQVFSNALARKRTEGALRESEAKYRALIETTGTGYVIIDAAGRVLDANREYVRLTGRTTLEEILGRPVTEWTAPHDQARNAEEIKQCVARGFVRDLELEYVGPTGERLPIEINATVLPRTGEIRVVSLCRDISERKRGEQVLTATRARLQYLIAATPTVIYTARPDRHFEPSFVSENVKTLLGFSPAEFVENPQFWWEHLHPEDLPAVVAGLSRLFAQGVNAHEYRMRCKGGGYRWICDEMKLVRDAAGQPSEIVGHWMDVTDRRRAEEALRQSEKRYRILAEAAQDYIFIIDRDDRIQYVNTFGARQLRGRPEDFIGQPRTRLFPPKVAERQGVSIQSVLSSGQPLYLEGLTQFPHGDVWLGTRLAPVVNEEGKVVAVLGISRDITERKRAEESLRQSEIKYRQLHESMTDAFVRTDMVGRIQEFNRAYREMLGYSEAELSGLTYLDLTPEKWHRFEAEIVREQILKRGFSDVYAKEYRRKDGTVFPVELRTFLIADQAGQPAAMWAIVRDITERRQSEVALRDLSHRLWRARDEEGRRIARDLHDSTAQQLAAVMMNLAQLEEQLSGQAIGALLHDSLALVEECTQQVRTLSYLLHPPVLDELGLAAALRSYLNGFSERSGIRVVLDVQESPPRFPEAVELALFRVVQEGLGNIHRHSGSRVARVRLISDAEAVRLEVSDPGRGVPPETLAAFRQGRVMRGVGLAGMRERLSQVNGRLDLESSPQGTTLRAVVPLREPPVNQ